MNFKCLFGHKWSDGKCERCGKPDPLAFLRNLDLTPLLNPENVPNNKERMTTEKFAPSKYRGNTPEDDRRIIHALKSRYLLTMWEDAVLEHGCVTIARVHPIESGEDSLETLFVQSKQSKS